MTELEKVWLLTLALLLVIWGGYAVGKINTLSDRITVLEHAECVRGFPSGDRTCVVGDGK